MPKVSVIVPNYNHSRYLKDRIDSILGQTYKDFELILMDDNSSDNSREILESYRKYPFVTLLFNTVNSGSSFKQWNKGTMAATGEYIWVAESDDVADKEFLSTVVPILDADKDISLAYSQSYDIDENGAVKGVWLNHTKGFEDNIWTADFVANGNDLIKKYMIYLNCLPNASGVLIRKSKMEEVGWANEKFKLNGDWEFWIKMMLGTKVGFTAKCLNYFRTHSLSVRSEATKLGIGIYEYSKIITYIFKHINFTKKEKLEVFEWFFSKAKWNPEFYKWSKEPLVFNYICKTYWNLLPQGIIAYRYFVEHLLRRFPHTYYLKLKRLIYNKTCPR